MMEENKLTGWARFWGVIVNPVPTFKAIGEDPRILLPALVIIAINVLLAWLIIPETIAYTETLLESSGQAMSGEALNAALTGTKVSIIVGSALMPPLIWLVQAALLAVVKQFTVGEATFKQLYAVSFFAWLPPFLGSAIKSVLVKMVGFDSAMAVQTSLALFLPSSIKSGFWLVLLSKVDFFVLWGLVLLSLGGATVMKKEPWKTGIYVFAAWLICAAVVAFLSSKFASVPGM